MKREIGFERSRIVTSIFEQQPVCLTIRAAKASERRKVHPLLFRQSQKQEVMKNPHFVMSQREGLLNPPLGERQHRQPGSHSVLLDSVA